jgi:TolB protein
MRTLLAVAIVLLAPALPSSAASQGGAAATELVFSSTFSGDREIFTASADGSNRVDLTRDPHADITPSWSADGKRIAFASNRSGAFEIYVMNADGSNVVRVTHDNAYADDPRFTGYDKAIVYESNKGGNWEIRRIGVGGSGEADLTRNRAADRYPATSPRGAIAFTSDRGRAGEHIWVMRWNGTSPRQMECARERQGSSPIDGCERS